MESRWTNSYNVGDLQKVFESRPLQSVILSEDKEKLTFTFRDGKTHSYGVEGDCCSQSWIEHLDLPPMGVADAVVTGVDDVGDAKGWDMHVCDEPDRPYAARKCGHDCLQIYTTVFHTTHGDIVLEYRNDSNGYYGGYLVDLDKDGEE